MPRHFIHLHGWLLEPGPGGPIQLHRPRVAALPHESTNKGNCQLKTLLIMSSYFFNSSPLDILSSLHSVLANYTCKTNRKLNIPRSRDCRGSVRCCSGGSKVGHTTGAALLQPPRPFPIPGRVDPSQALSGGTSQGVLPGTGTAGW